MLAGRALGLCGLGGQKADLELAMLCPPKAARWTAASTPPDRPGPNREDLAMHPAFLVPAPCPANLTLPEVQHSRMAEGAVADYLAGLRSEEHTSELQSLMRISYAVFCLKKKETSHAASARQAPHVNETGMTKPRATLTQHQQSPSN